MSILSNDSGINWKIEVGAKAPDFILKTEKGKTWQLSQHFGSVIALLFYPKSETLVCTRQMCALRDGWVDCLETKAEIVGISPGTTVEHESFSTRYQLPMPILADTDREVTEIYSRHWLMPIQFSRAVVVIDSKGIVRHRQVMFRAFRPTIGGLLASIYAARTESLYEHYDVIKGSYQNTRFL